MSSVSDHAGKYMLDTNILSDLVRRPQGRIAEHIRHVGEDSVCTSIVVAAELRFGAVKSGSARLHQQVRAVLGALETLPAGSPMDYDYAEIRTALERSGCTIGPNDMLIAAHARSLGCTVVTANVDEFSRVPKLRVENWLDAES